MTPSPAALSAAEEIYNWEGLSMPLVRELAEIIDRHMAAKPVSAEDVGNYVMSELANILTQTTYASINVSAIGFRKSVNVKPIFRVTAGDTLVYGEGSDFAEAFAQILKQTDGKSEAEMMRERAQELLEKAAILDSKREPEGGGA